MSPSKIDDNNDDIYELEELISEKDIKVIYGNFFLGIPNELFFVHIFQYFTYKDISKLFLISNSFYKFLNSSDAFEYQKRSFEKFFNSYYKEDLQEHYDLNFNILIYGDSNVGKRSLINRICFGRLFNSFSNEFNSSWTLKSSTGLFYEWNEEVLSLESILEANSYILRKFWIYILPEGKCQNCNVENIKKNKIFENGDKWKYGLDSEKKFYLVMFSFDNQNSFQNSKKIISKLFEFDEKYAKKRIILVANKSDLKEICSFKKSIDLFLTQTNLQFFEISTRTTEGLRKLIKEFDKNIHL